MRFQTKLIPAKLIRRYKRFLADCRLVNGQEVTAHCPNPGSMMDLAQPGMKIWLEPNDDPRKKLKYGWRLIEYNDGNFVGVDTSLPNKVLLTALKTGKIKSLSHYNKIHPEQRYGRNSRIDFLLYSEGSQIGCYIEVKSVTLSRLSGRAEFPDSVTTRGAKHLEELTKVVQNGHRAIIFYLIQRTDCTQFSLASDIDPTYTNAHIHAAAMGVETLCYDTNINKTGVTINAPVAITI